MTIMWSTAVNASSKVSYGLEVMWMTMGVAAHSVHFTKGNDDGLQYLHRAVLMVRQEYTNINSLKGHGYNFAAQCM